MRFAGFKKVALVPLLTNILSVIIGKERKPYINQSSQHYFLYYEIERITGTAIIP